MGHFERFRVASGLADKDSAYQVNSLLYIMGERSDDILTTIFKPYFTNLYIQYMLLTYYCSTVRAEYSVIRL